MILAGETTLVRILDYVEAIIKALSPLLDEFGSRPRDVGDRGQ
jgi:hypothetical protein